MLANKFNPFFQLLQKRLASSTNTFDHILSIPGPVFERRRRQRCHERRRVGFQHPLVHQLPRLTSQEALAERQVPLHQIHHGTSHQIVLKQTIRLWSHFATRDNI